METPISNSIIWSHGRRQSVAGSFGDFADQSAARSSGNFTLYLTDGEVGGHCQVLNLSDHLLRNGGTPQMFSPRLHAGAGRGYLDVAIETVHHRLGPWLDLAALGI